VLCKYKMFSNTSTGLKLHLLLIIIIAGVAYFMYQLYSECKDLERELIVAKRQLAILASQKDGEGDCLATLMQCPLGTKCASGTCKLADKAKKPKDSKKSNEAIEEADEEIDIDEDEVSIKSDYINKVMANVQQSQKEEEEESDSESDSDSESESDEEDEAKVVEAVEAVKAVDAKTEAVVSHDDSSDEESSDDESVETDLSKLSKAELSKLKIPELKDYLKGRKQSVTGTKGDLVSRILALA